MITKPPDPYDLCIINPMSRLLIMCYCTFSIVIVPSRALLHDCDCSFPALLAAPSSPPPPVRIIFHDAVPCPAQLTRTTLTRITRALLMLLHKIRTVIHPLGTVFMLFRDIKLCPLVHINVSSSYSYSQLYIKSLFAFVFGQLPKGQVPKTMIFLVHIYYFVLLYTFQVSSSPLRCFVLQGDRVVQLSRRQSLTRWQVSPLCGDSCCCCWCRTLRNVNHTDYKITNTNTLSPPLAILIWLWVQVSFS